MATRNRKRKFGLAVPIIAAGSLLFAACSSDDDSASDTASPTTEESAQETTTTMMEADSGSSEEMAMPTGPACAAVPADGEGSFDGMADDPAATAASNNPELSTLVAAVTAAELGDTLNGEGPFTIFAPANAAFDAIPPETLDAVLADQAQLTDILTLHVVAGEKLSSSDLAAMDSVETVNGAEITFSASGDEVMVNGQATVVCADVPTANATVHIIDGVLMPQS